MKNSYLPLLLVASLLIVSCARNNDSSTSSTSGSNSASSSSSTSSSSSSSSSDSSKPSKDIIQRDCAQLISETVDGYDGKSYLELQSVNVDGISNEGTNAKVIAILNVKYLPAMAETRHFTKGLAKVFGQKWVYNKQTLAGQTARLQVNMYYKKYDSGWRLESYN